MQIEIPFYTQKIVLKSKNLDLQQNHIFCIKLFIFILFLFFYFGDELKYFIEKRKPRRKPLPSRVTIAQKGEGHRGGSYSQHQNFQGSITRFEGPRKLTNFKVFCYPHIYSNPVKRIRFFQKALYRNVTKSPSIKGLGPISLLFPEIEHVYNFFFFLRRMSTTYVYRKLL